MEKTNDTIHDTLIVFLHSDAKSLSDSALVEEVMHRYDRLYKDIKSHDSTPAVVSILALIVIVISILNRRKKNKSNG